MSENLITHFDVSGSALTAERTKMRIIANNIANVHSTRTREGGPYQRQFVVLQSEPGPRPKTDIGVAVKEIATDSSAPRLAYDPGHPDANEQGYVAYPAITMVQEVSDLKMSSMAYQANISVINATKQMINRSIDILK